MAEPSSTRCSGRRMLLCHFGSVNVVGLTYLRTYRIPPLLSVLGLVRAIWTCSPKTDRKLCSVHRSGSLEDMTEGSHHHCWIRCLSFNPFTVGKIGVQLYVVPGARPALYGAVRRVCGHRKVRKIRDNLFGLERLGWGGVNRGP